MKNYFALFILWMLATPSFSQNNSVMSNNLILKAKTKMVTLSKLKIHSNSDLRSASVRMNSALHALGNVEDQYITAEEKCEKIIRKIRECPNFASSTEGKKLISSTRYVSRKIYLLKKKLSNVQSSISSSHARIYTASKTRAGGISGRYWREVRGEAHSYLNDGIRYWNSFASEYRTLGRNINFYSLDINILHNEVKNYDCPE